MYCYLFFLLTSAAVEELQGKLLGGQVMHPPDQVMHAVEFQLGAATEVHLACFLLGSFQTFVLYTPFSTTDFSAEYTHTLSHTHRVSFNTRLQPMGGTHRKNKFDSCSWETVTLAEFYDPSLRWEKSHRQRILQTGSVEKDKLMQTNIYVKFTVCNFTFSYKCFLTFYARMALCVSLFSGV